MSKMSGACKLAGTQTPTAVRTVDGLVMWRLPNGGVLHREDGPAIERPNGSQEWYQNGQLHRLDGPANIWASGTKAWFYHGQKHRDDGPAIERPDGGFEWFHHGVAHRDDGPALRQADGTLKWFQHGVLHRADGPAVSEAIRDAHMWYQHGKRHRTDGPAVWIFGPREWWLWGVEVTEVEVSQAQLLSSEALAIAQGLFKDWDGTFSCLFDTASLLAAKSTACS